MMANYQHAGAVTLLVISVTIATLKSALTAKILDMRLVLARRQLYAVFARKMAISAVTAGIPGTHQ